MAIPTLMVIDTGADVSLFARSFAPLLGIDIGTELLQASTQGISGRRESYVLRTGAPIRAKIGPDIDFTLPIVHFIDAPKESAPPSILGTDALFDSGDLELWLDRDEIRMRKKSR